MHGGEASAALTLVSPILLFLSVPFVNQGKPLQKSYMAVRQAIAGSTKLS